MKLKKAKKRGKNRIFIKKVLGAKQMKQMNEMKQANEPHIVVSASEQLQSRIAKKYVACPR